MEGAGEEAPLKPRGLAPKRMREKQAGGTKRRGGAGWYSSGRKEEEEAEAEECITEAGRWKVASGRVQHQPWWQ